jgi:hypothetical protein
VFLYFKTVIDRGIAASRRIPSVKLHWRVKSTQYKTANIYISLNNEAEPDNAEKMLSWEAYGRVV